MFKTNTPFANIYQYTYRSPDRYLKDKSSGDFEYFERAYQNLSYKMNPYASKSEYLHWVKDWKKDYNNLSQCIRDTRKHVKIKVLISNGVNENEKVSYKRLIERENLSRIANAYLNLRKNYKLLSSLRLWEEQK